MEIFEIEERLNEFAKLLDKKNLYCNKETHFQLVRIFVGYINATIKIKNLQAYIEYLEKKIKENKNGRNNKRY